MRTEQISSELSSQISSMSEIASSDELSDAEKAQKLKAMKSATLEKIASEFDGVTIISQSILDNIRTIVQNEEWAKLPPPQQLSISLAVASSVTLELHSISTKILPDLQGFQRLFLEIMRELINNLSRSEVIGMDQNFQAANLEFDNSEKAAFEERTSGLVSGALGIVTAATSMIAKSVVTVKSAQKASELMPEGQGQKLKEVTEKHQQVQKEYNDANKQVLDAKKVIQEYKIQNLNAKDRLQQKNISAKESQELQREIKMREIQIADSETRLSAAEAKLAKETENLKLASINLQAVTAGVESSNSSLQQEVQKLRGYNDIVDQVSQILQSTGKFATSFVDYKSKEFKIDADKNAFIKNFAASIQQNARKDMQDIRDAINSCMSTLGAILQTLDAAVSYANKTV